MKDKTRNENSVTITLDTPIKRGETEITQVTVLKPNTGHLRGEKLTDIMSMDVDALTKILPRVAPDLLETDIKQLELPDFVRLGNALVSFLLPRAARETIQNN